MKETQRNDFFGTESIPCIFLKVAPPVMLVQLIQSLYNLVDSYFIGRILYKRGKRIIDDTIWKKGYTVMMIFDTHAHYDDEAFNEDRDVVLKSDTEISTPSRIISRFLLRSRFFTSITGR